MDRIDEAVDLLSETDNINKEVLGPEHPQSLTSSANLATFLSLQGSLDKAVELERHVWNIRQKCLGPAHIDTLTSQANLSGTLFQMGYL